MLSVCLAIAAWAASIATFVDKNPIVGPAVSVGCARGTASVVAAVATPLMIAGIWLASQGSLRAVIVWLGASGYLVYHAFTLLFATPYNKYSAH